MEILRQYQQPIHAVFIAIGGGGLIGGVSAYIKRLRPEIKIIGVEPVDANAMYQSMKAGYRVCLPRENITDETLVAIACGANMNFDRLRFVSERAEFGERREAIFAVTIPEARGSFLKFCECIGKRNLTEFNYRIADNQKANIFVGVQIQDRVDAAQIGASFEAQGFKTIDLTDDELAKMHLRHMVGGRSPLANNELLYRFEFPERPGALIRFLSCMSPNWNISLFHYRNNGADYGRIAVGMQVPPDEMNAWQKFLNSLGYRYWDESTNPSYKLFLS